MHIKICDIKDVHTARFCGNLHVDMIGVHAIRKLKKKNIRSYRLIGDELRRFYPSTVPVLVTKMKDPIELAKILKRIKFEYVQLYALDEESLAALKGKLAAAESVRVTRGISQKQTQLLDELVSELGRIKKKTIFFLKRNVKFILTFPVSGLDIKFLKYVLIRAKGIADFFLLDSSVVGGTGFRADINKVKVLLKTARPVRTFIAGGLNPGNVRGVLRSLRPLAPFGVDVQSGVSDLNVNNENPKNPKLVIEFVSRVRSQRNVVVRFESIKYPTIRDRLISWAITDLTVTEDLPRMFSILRKTNIDTVHIDFSDGSIAPNFIRMPFGLLENFTHHLPCMNYDIHLFISDIEKQYTVINDCLQRNALLKTVYFHVLAENKLAATQIASVSDYCKNLHINLGLAIQSTQFNDRRLRELFVSIFNERNRLFITELSLITHSKRHTLPDATINDRRILAYLARSVETIFPRPFISIDRDMTLEKAKALASAISVNQIIVGKDLNQRIEPLLTGMTDNHIFDIIQAHITRYRKLLAHAS